MQNQSNYSRINFFHPFNTALLFRMMTLIFAAWSPSKKVKFNPNALKDKKYLDKVHSEITKEINGFNKPKKNSRIQKGKKPKDKKAKKKTPLPVEKTPEKTQNQKTVEAKEEKKPI